MNKKIIALALTSAFALPMAAQAETTLYGQFNLSFDSVQTNNPSPTVQRHPSSIVSNNSRLGVKGIEALGGGLNAVYQVESQFDADSSTRTSNGLATRNTFVGLNNARFGTFWAGRNDTPYKRATGAFDPFSETIGDMNNIISAVPGSAGGAYGGGSGALAFHQRLNRSLGYDGAWGGLYLGLQAGTQPAPIAGSAPTTGVFVPEAPATGTNPAQRNWTTVSGLIGYRVAGFDVNYSIEQNRNAGPGTQSANARAQQVGVGYTLPAQYMGVKLGAVYEKITSDAVFPVSGAVVNNDWDKRNWWVGASVPFTPKDSFGISYGRGGSINALGGDNGAKQAAVGLNHQITKNTSLYAVYAHLKNDANGTSGFGVDHGAQYTPGTAGGQTVKGVSLGMLTKF